MTLAPSLTRRVRITQPGGLLGCCGRIVGMCQEGCHVVVLPFATAARPDPVVVAVLVGDAEVVE